MRKLSRSRKSMELSINFIVVMIISIVVFALGIFFVKQIYTYATKTTEDTAGQFDLQVQNLLCDARDIVCIPKDSVEFGKEKNPYYGVVITYVGSATEQEFVLKVSPKKYVSGTNSETDISTDGTKANWIKISSGTFTIKNNGVAKKKIALTPTSAQSGTYIFDVRVCKLISDPCSVDSSPPDGIYDDQYGPTQKIYLYVP